MSGVEYKSKRGNPLCPVPEKNCPLYRTVEGFCKSIGGPMNCGAYTQKTIGSIVPST